MIEIVRLGRPSSAAPVVAVPGLDGSPGSLLPIAQALGRTREVFIVDYRRETSPGIESLVGEMAATLGKTVDGPFDLIGQSIGTIFAAQLDARGDLPVKRVGLCCTFTKLRWTVLRINNVVLGLTPRPLFRMMSPLGMKLVCGPVGDGGDHPFFAAVKEADKAGVLKRTAWQIDRDFAIDLAKVRSPLLILMGEKDRFVRDAAGEIEILRRLFAGRDARVEVVPGAGHVILPSKSIDFAVRQLETFLT